MKKMTKKPLISIITINYNHAEVTNQLLKSLELVTWKNLEIIIVDNNSEKDDVAKLNFNYKNTTLICNSKNLGFAGGNNIGINASKGDYILLLNNDTEVDRGFIEPMVSLMINSPEIGAVSPKIRFFYQPDTIQYAGFSKMNPFTLRMNAIGSKQFDDGSFDYCGETNFAHGCAMLIPRFIIEKVGLMPEIFFLYYEEHDWSMSIKNAGYKIYFQPKSIVYHKESITIKKNSVTKTYYLNRNRILFMKRNMNFFQIFISTLFLLSVSIPKNSIQYLLKREFNHLKAYWNAILWNVSNLKPKQTL